MVRKRIGLVLALTVASAFCLGLGPSLLQQAAAADGPRQEASASQAGALSVRVTGLRNAKGSVRISVCDTERCYDQEEGYIVESNKNTDPQGVLFAFPDLPAGTYAFTIYHDEDNDNEFDRSFIGLPQEGFAFSNNIRPTVSKPDFDEVSFPLGDDPVETTITMIYW